MGSALQPKLARTGIRKLGTGDRLKVFDIEFFN